MKSNGFRVAMGQMLVEGAQPERNLERAVDMIQRAGQQGCAVVVLPECLDVGWSHPSARELAQPIPGRYSALLCQAARSAGVYVAAGLTERDGALLYNAAVLISPQGQVLHKHRKINELDFARQLYSTGASLAVTPTPLGAIGITICADNFADSLVLGQALGRMGARLLLSPCAWAVEAEHDNAREPYGRMWRESYTTLAKQYGMTVVGVSNVGWMRGGPWQGRKCIGCSLAVGPGGVILREGPYGEAAEALLVVEVSPSGSLSPAMA